MERIMPCIAGITTDLDRRKKEHKRDYPKLNNWKTYGPYSTRSEAQQKENELAKGYGCRSHHGGCKINRVSSKLR